MPSHNKSSLDDPVTIWINRLRNAEDSAAEKIWNHFARRPFESARKKLQSKTRAVYNEEDAAQNAFQSVFAGVAAGRFPDLGDRARLWRSLWPTRREKCLVDTNTTTARGATRTAICRITYLPMTRKVHWAGQCNNLTHTNLRQNLLRISLRRAKRFLKVSVIRN